MRFAAIRATVLWPCVLKLTRSSTRNAIAIIIQYILIYRVNPQRKNTHYLPRENGEPFFETITYPEDSLNERLFLRVSRDIFERIMRLTALKLARVSPRLFPDRASLRTDIRSRKGEP
jgi:hypothetical protein